MPAKKQTSSTATKSSATAKSKAKSKSKAKAKSKAKSKSKAKAKPEASTPAIGRAPNALPDLGDGFDELAQLEQLGIEQGYAANTARAKLVERDLDAAIAAALIQRIGFDFGEVPRSVDTSKAKTKAERAALDKAHTALVGARYQRHETLAALYKIAARDLAFQEKAFRELAALPDERFRFVVQHALMTSGRLAPVLLSAAKEWVFENAPGRRSTAATALFKQGHDVAFATIGAQLTSLDRDDVDAVNRVADLVSAGTAAEFWSAVRNRAEWRALLQSFAALIEGKFDSSKGDRGRALWQLGTEARAALDSMNAPPTLAAGKTSTSTRTSTRTRTTGTMTTAQINKPALNASKLASAAGREALLDELGAWITDVLASAKSDDEARAAMRGAISAFYDVREGADQPRGEFAGAFFQVDGVGLGNTKRPVPWQQLRVRVGDERIAALDVLFEEVEPTVT